MAIFDHVFAVICPECKDNVFVLYNWGPYQICLDCCQESLTIQHGTVRCKECRELTVMEKTTPLLVEKDNKRVTIANEFLYCTNCEAKAMTAYQVNMKKYRLALALRDYKIKAK